MSLRLSDIKKGTVVEIKSIDDSDMRSKLLELGLIPKQLVEVLFIAPLGDPMAIQVKDFVLALRKDESKHIEVEMLSPTLS